MQGEWFKKVYITMEQEVITDQDYGGYQHSSNEKGLSERDEHWSSYVERLFNFTTHEVPELKKSPPCSRGVSSISSVASGGQRLYVLFESVGWLNVCI